VNTRAEEAGLDREWFLRALLVLQAPRAVFVALRDDSDAAAYARQEPLLALTWLAGIAGVLASSVARTLLDDPVRDGLVVAIWAFIGGGVYAAAVFWLGGALVHGASQALGGQEPTGARATSGSRALRSLSRWCFSANRARRLRWRSLPHRRVGRRHRRRRAHLDRDRLRVWALAPS
jgi:hypothetical protein